MEGRKEWRPLERREVAVRAFEMAGLRGRKLAHPLALEPRRCGTWGNSSVPVGRDLTFYRQRQTKAVMDPEGEQKEKESSRRRVEGLVGHRAAGPPPTRP